MSTSVSVLVIFGWICIVMAIAISSKNLWPKQQELSRKIVHIGTGPVIPLAWWMNVPAGLAISFSCLITLSLIINKKFKLLPAIEDIQRKSYGTIAYGLSITLLFSLFWPENPAAVSSGVLVMAFGDGFAGLIGRHFRSNSWEILGQRKSIIGTLTMGLVGAVVLITIAFISEAGLSPFQIFLITGFAVCLEQIGPWGIDNLTVPIGVAYAWVWMTRM